MALKLEIEIVGKVIGYQKVGESEEDAANRLILEAEMRGNTGESRVHLQRARKLFPAGVFTGGGCSTQRTSRRSAK